MKERIEQLAAGSVLVRQPELEFSPAYLEGRIEPQTVQSRELVIRVKNKVPFKGFFYSTNDRVKIETRQAAGLSAAVLFEISAIDTNPGDELRGAIIVVGNSGEHRIEYCYTVCAPQTQERLPQTIEEFTQLYRQDPASAVRLFSGSEFVRLPFIRGDVKKTAVYEGLLQGTHEHQALDAFLVAMKQKEPVYLKPETAKQVLQEEDLGEEESVAVTASTWGWLWAEVSSDAPWLLPEKKRLTFRDFTDQQARLVFHVDRSGLHKGRNIARLKLTTPMQCCTVCVEVIRQQRGSGRSVGQPPKAIVRYLYRLLLAYINESHEESVIFSQMDQCLEENSKRYPACFGLHLYRAWLFLQQGRVREAGKLLDWCRANLERTPGSRESDYALVLYLESLLTRREADRLRAAETMQELLKTDQSLVTGMIWMFVNPDFSSDDRLRLLEELYKRFGAKPILYACAARLYREEPGQVKRAGEFQLQVLSYMLRYGCLTQELAEQYLSLPLVGLENAALLYQLMKRLYACYKDNRVLSLICSALIRLGRTSPAYASWYELGIQQEINLTGLNDAFMTSISDQIPQRELPSGILLYYSFKNDLDNQTRLNLYTYILSHFTKESDMYQAYEPQMDEFAIRQLLDGKINPQLVHLYDNLLSPGLIDEHLGHVLVSLLFSRQITCSLPYARKAVVHYAQLRPEQSARITGCQVCLPVYAEDSAILFEDAMGNRYCDPDMKQIPLMYREDLVAVCRKKAPDHLMLMVQEADRFYKMPIPGAEGMKLAFDLLKKQELRASFRSLLTERMVEYCYFHSDETREYDTWLMSVDPASLSAKQRTYLIELYIKRGYSREAFECVCAYGCGQIQPALLLRMTVRRITESLYEYHDGLVSLCRRLLSMEQIHETLLTYLCIHYNGPTEEMFSLLMAAKQARVESRDLAERTVTQMLFTGEKKHLDEAYAFLIKKGTVSEKLARAVLVTRCHDSLMEESILPDEVTASLQKLLLEPGSGRLPEVFSLALLQQYSFCSSLDPDAKHLCEQLLYAYCAKGVYMKCFHGLRKLIELPHQMEGRIIVQWIGMPARHVWLSGELLPQKKKITYEMHEIYPGIYTADVFLFPDETVRISVRCTDGQEEKIVKEVLLDAESCYCRSGSIYSEIQKLIQLEDRENYVQWKQECIKAIRNREAAKELFTLL